MTTIDKALKIAVETNNMPFLEWVFTQGEPTNLSECLLLATEKNQVEQIAFLTKKLPPQLKVVKKRALHLQQSNNCYCHSQSMGNISQLMFDLKHNKHKAETDLEEGEISKEEINYQNHDGYTALHYVCNNVANFMNPEKLVQKLLDAGADVNLLTKDNSTVLNLLFRNCESSETVYKVAKILMKIPGIVINKFNNYGTDVMYYALAYFDDKLIEILLDNPEYDVNSKDNSGNTVLMKVSRQFKHKENMIKILQVLLNHSKIDINTQNNEGMTALMFLCENIETVNCFEKCASLFLAHPQIDLKIKTNAGQTALDIACPNYKCLKSFDEKMNA